jgi:hypothetical protein
MNYAQKLYRKLLNFLVTPREGEIALPQKPTRSEKRLTGHNKCVWQVDYLKKIVVCEGASRNQVTQDFVEARIVRKQERLKVTEEAQF